MKGFVYIVLVIPIDISAETNQVIVTPINEKISLEKTIIQTTRTHISN